MQSEIFHDFFTEFGEYVNAIKSFSKLLSKKYDSLVELLQKYHNSDMLFVDKLISIILNYCNNKQPGEYLEILTKYTIQELICLVNITVDETKFDIEKYSNDIIETANATLKKDMAKQEVIFIQLIILFSKLKDSRTLPIVDQYLRSVTSDYYRGELMEALVMYFYSIPYNNDVKRVIKSHANHNVDRLSETFQHDFTNLQ